MRYTPLCHLILLSALTLHAERTIHVDGAARAPGDGSPEHPFATLTAARDAIRARRTSDASQEPVTVLIAPGDYRFTAPFELNEADSGTSDAPITYRAAQPLKIRIQYITQVLFSQPEIYKGGGMRRESKKARRRAVP